MRTARRIAQIFFLTLFLWLFLRATFPYEVFIPSDMFLRASPLVAITTMLASRSFIASATLAIIVLALTIFLGRFFCGWICPLGTIIDGSDNLIKRKRKKASQRDSTRFRSWKFMILAATLVAALFSVQLIWVFDPIALLTRVLTTSVYPIFAFFFESIFAVGFQIPFLEDPMLSIYDFAQANFMPVQQPQFFEGIVIFLFFTGILALGRISRRFWCRNLCPLGALLGIFSKYRLTKRFVSDACTDCGLCQRDCKMNAVEDDYTINSTVECIECMECVAVCPPKAISYTIGRSRGASKIDLSRRSFMQSGFAGLLSLGLLKTAALSRNQKGTAIRPPGSLPESDFMDRCIRCHECVRICATTGACLQPSVLEGGWEGIWTPRAVPRVGYCEYNCTLCGEVCPTGAIHKLPLEEKQKTKMGLAFFDKSRCIPWYRHEDCLVCEEHCPTPDKAIKFDVREVVTHDGSKRVVKFPYVVEELCIGCGICETKCPVIGKAGIFVTNAMEQRWGAEESY